MPRTQLPFSQQWKYHDSFESAYLDPAYDDRHFTMVTLPHSNIELPYNYFDERDYQFVSCYRKIFTLDSQRQGQQIFLDAGGVMTYAEVFLNGTRVGSHKGGYTPFSINLTPYLRFDAPNVLVIKVDSRERDDIPPFGGSIDYLTFGGIYREVTLRIVDPLYIENLHARPQDVLARHKRLKTSVFLNNASAQPHTAQLKIRLRDGDTTLAEASQSVTIVPHTQQVNTLTLADLTGITLWDIDTPYLYELDVTLTTEDNGMDDLMTTRLGFRTAEVTPQGFMLNGRNVMLCGLNRHQTFPYVGQAMPARVQHKDADILKHELHLNLVRTSHYPQSRHFLDRCDEIGLLVLEEIPGWQHIGDTAWKQVACDNVREMIQRDWNHPSIILWGVRINESADDHEFYAETNRIAHQLDSTRQTCGIRCIPNSELLEDVYTMNDFSHSGGELALKPQQSITGLTHAAPYMVTEFNGHMYPTKRFDQEERLVEHALRHARVQNQAAADPEISGAIGWCAFDYNTHHNFGSGDRICYHGVMDMFRLPKMAAHFYRSQVAPETELVLEPATLWARGERSIGGVIPLTVFTNCESVKIYYGEHEVGEFFPNFGDFPALAHPPVTIDITPPETFGIWGHSWEDGHFVGYIKGQAVIERRFVSNPVPAKLCAVADDAVLHADGSDATRVVFTLLDQAGNLLPYIPDFLKLTLTGPGDIIGPHEVALIGGCIAVWVRAQQEAGTLTLSAASSRVQANEITIDVIDHNE